MKKFVLIIAAVAVTGIMSSCKKCSTCTKTDAEGEHTSEFCGSGNTYKNQLEIHENSGWECTEK